MSSWCSDIVELFGSYWNFIGWGLFLSWFFLPFFPISEPALFWSLWLTVGGLLLLWWVIDAVNEGVAWWQMGIVVILVALSFAPVGYARLLAIAAWVIYQFRFREM